MAVEIASVVAAAHAALKARAARINALNVYPVPDGDTGTNMLLTLEAVLEEVSDKTYETPADATRAVARAALMGARGNSGVILSQILRGACDALGQTRVLDAEALAAAFAWAKERAYAAVVILSQMIRGGCEALAGRDSLSAEAFAAALEGARERAYSSVGEPVEGTMLTVINPHP